MPDDTSYFHSNYDCNISVSELSDSTDLHCFRPELPYSQWYLAYISEHNERIRKDR